MSTEKEFINKRLDRLELEFEKIKRKINVVQNIAIYIAGLLSLGATKEIIPIVAALAG